MIGAAFGAALTASLSRLISRLISRLWRLIGRGEAKARAPSVWLAGSTHRWHTHRYFASTQDRVDAHSGRVALLILQLYPDAPASLLRAALVHDLGEYATGDMSGPAKRRNPEVYAGIADLERRALADLGFPAADLFPLEAGLLKLADGLDAYLWGVHHRPDYVCRSEAWRAMFAFLRRDARALGVLSTFDEIVKGVKDGNS